MSVLMLISFTHVKCTWNIGKIDIRILHSWFTKNCETYRFSKFAYDDIREVHKRRYLLQPIAIEVFSGDGRNHLLAFPRKIRNKVYAKWVVVIQSTFIVLRTKLCMFDCSKLFSFILLLSWVGLFRLQPDFQIQVSFRKQWKWLWSAFWVWILTFQDSDVNLVPSMF